MSDVKRAAGRVMTQAFEGMNRSPGDFDGDGLSNDQDPYQHDPDTDGDGVADGGEVVRGTRRDAATSSRPSHRR